MSFKSYSRRRKLMIHSYFSVFNSSFSFSKQRINSWNKKEQIYLLKNKIFCSISYFRGELSSTLTHSLFWYPVGTKNALYPSVLIWKFSSIKVILSRIRWFPGSKILSLFRVCKIKWNCEFNNKSDLRANYIPRGPLKQKIFEARFNNKLSTIEFAWVYHTRQLGLEKMQKCKNMQINLQKTNCEGRLNRFN